MEIMSTADAGIISGPMFVASVTGVCASLAGAIGVLWRVVIANMKKTEDRLTAKLDECELKHHDANAKVLELIEKVSHIEGFVEGIKATNPPDISAFTEHIMARIAETQLANRP